MRPMGRLRWKMLVLMLCGTIVIYVDRNVLGVLAPILKKDLNFSTEQYSYVVSAFQLVYSFSQPVAGYLTDLIGPRIGYAVAAVIWGAAAAAHGLATGWLSMAGFRAAAGPQRGRRDPDWHEGVDHLVSLAGAVDRDRLVQLRLLDRIDDHAAPRDLAGLGLRLAARVPDHRHARRPPGDRLVLALSGSRGAPGPFRGRARLHHLRPGTPAGAKPSIGAIFAHKKFLGIIIARFLTEPAWQTFAFWIPLYMVSVRGMDIKQFALFAWLPFLFSDIGCIFGGYLAPIIHNRFGIHMVNARLSVITIGALCMVGPALISFVADPITAILCFSLGGFAHQMLSSMMYALMGDVFEKPEVATATGVAGMFGYLGGALFTLMVGALASSIGYEPLFALLFLFDLVAALTLWAFIGVRHGEVAEQPAS